MLDIECRAELSGTSERRETFFLSCTGEGGGKTGAVPLGLLLRITSLSVSLCTLLCSLNLLHPVVPPSFRRIKETHQTALTHPSRPLTPSTPTYRLVPSLHTISSTSVPTPSGAGGIPLPFNSSLLRLLISTQSFIDSSTSAPCPGGGRGIAEKGVEGPPLPEEPERTRLGVECPDFGSEKMGQ